MTGPPRTRSGDAALVALAAMVGAVGCATGPEPLLSQLDGPLRATARLGALVSTASDPVPFGVVVVIALALCALGVRERVRGRGSAAELLLPLGLALIAQLSLQLGATFVGLAMYGMTSLSLLNGPPEEARGRAKASAWDLAGGAAGLALYVVLALWQLDVRPELDFDEFAYLKAVLISAGELPAGERIGRVYELARFEALPIALAWQSVWVSLAGPDVLSTRFASVAACGLALVGAAAILGARLGARAAALGILFGATAPLLLAYARLGLQVSGSILHGTLAIGLWLMVRERWSTGLAALLGLVLGASLFLYQLSWFVPVLAVPALLVAAWRDGGAAPRRAVIVVVLTAGLVAGSGAFLLRAEFGTLWEQTESRRTWESHSVDRTGGQQRFILPGSATTREARRAARGLHADGVDTWMARTDSGAHVLALIGEPAACAPLVELAREQGWRPLSAGGATPFGAVGHALGFLFRDAHLQNPDALIDTPTLRPLLAPLLVVGLVRLWRRRSTRSLVWWVLGATFVPVLFAGAETRRVVLAAPLVFGVAAWPLVELCNAFATQRARFAAVAASVLVALSIGASGVHLSLERWDQRVEVKRVPVNMLALARVLEQLPESERVLIPRGMLTNAFGSAARLAAGVREGPEATRRFAAVGAADIGGEGGLLRVSCAERVPFTWVLPPRADAQLRFGELDRDFALERQQIGELQLLRIRARRPGGCAR